MLAPQQGRNGERGKVLEISVAADPGAARQAIWPRGASRPDGQPYVTQPVAMLSAPQTAAIFSDESFVIRSTR